MFTLKTQKAAPVIRLVCVETNPGPGLRPRLSEEERLRVIDLSTEMHLSPTRIATRMKIARSTVYHILGKYSETGSARDRPGRGRKRILTEADEKRVVRKQKKEKCATEIVRELKAESGIAVSVDTVRRVINKHGLRFLIKETVQELSARNKEK